MMILTACSMNSQIETNTSQDNTPVITPSTGTVKFVAYDIEPTPKDGWEALLEKVVYPQLACEAQIEGTVLVKTSIDENGKVTDLFIAKGIPNTGLDEAALNAVRSTEFIPAKKDGQPVTVQITIPVLFKLK